MNQPLEHFVQNNLETDFKHYLGENVKYYLPYFSYLEGGKLWSWNWSAFLFQPIWLAYRKLYRILGAYIILVGLEIGLRQTLGEGLPVFVWVGVFAIFGLLGNQWIISRAQKVIFNAAKHSNPIARENYIIQHGGISIFAAWIAGIAFFALQVWTSYLILEPYQAQIQILMQGGDLLPLKRFE